MGVLFALSGSTAVAASLDDKIEIMPGPSCVKPSSCESFSFSLTNRGSLTIDGMTIQLALPNTITAFGIVGQPDFRPTGVQGALVGYPLKIGVGQTVTGSGTASSPLAVGASFKIFVTRDAFTTATSQDVGLTLPNCGSPRAAVAAAQAKILALTQERQAVYEKYVRAEREVDQARYEVRNLYHLATSVLGPIVNIVGTLNEGDRALADAQTALEKADRERLAVADELFSAKDDLDEAQVKLRKCEGGQGLRLVAAVRPAAASAAPCAAKQEAFAAIESRRAVLVSATKRLAGTKMRPAELRLHAAIASLGKAAADPRAKAVAAKLRTIQGLMRDVDRVMLGRVRAFAGLAASARTATAQATAAKAALKACQRK